MPALDAQDFEIIARRVANLEKADTRNVRVGDVVEFADDVRKRVTKARNQIVQTSDDAEFYLDERWVVASGTSSPGVPRHTLTPTGRTELGEVWLFHHDEHRPGNQVRAQIAFRVWRCNEASEDRYCPACGCSVPGSHRHGLDTEPADIRSIAAGGER